MKRKAGMPAPAGAPERKPPMGKLIAVGGNEERGREELRADGNGASGHEAVLAHVLEEMRGKDSRIGIITTASGDPGGAAEMYAAAFGKLGCAQVYALHLDKRNVNSSSKLELLASLDGVFLSGGDQTKLLEKTTGSEFLKLLKKRYVESRFVIAGTSAGAMVMSAFMISEGESDESLRKGIVTLKKGWSLLPGTIIDTHFMSRGRFARLTEALLDKPGLTAIGLCEDTALVITEGNVLRAIGSGGIIVLEADQVKASNFRKAGKGTAIYVEGLQIHVLAAPVQYLLREKRFIAEE